MTMLKVPGDVEVTVIEFTAGEDLLVCYVSEQLSAEVVDALRAEIKIARDTGDVMIADNRIRFEVLKGARK